MIIRNLSLFVLTLGLCVGFSYAAINYYNPAIEINTNYSEEPGPVNAIQVALILDTSGSMNGLINQAKSQLWNILNVLAKTSKNGDDPDLEIALYEYGNPSVTDDAMQIHQLSPFTTDMDFISEKLFSLGTDGGEEYCGAVIQASLNDLNWNDGQNLKFIYIAGNEEFTQGPIDFKAVCQLAKSKGIIVNTIFCGNENEGIRGSWNMGARLGGGDYLSISQNEETVFIATPYDDEMEQLNIRLNKTYIPFGEKGEQKKWNQIKQDMNANKYSKSNMAERASFKVSKKYKAEDWDLVDAYKKDKSVLKKAQVKDDEMVDMTIEELEVNIRHISEEREEIETEIKMLDKKRRAYKLKESQKAGKGQQSLENSIVKTVKKHAKKKGYKISE